MKVEIRRIGDKAGERVIIECETVTREVKAIEAFALSTGAAITGVAGGRMLSFSLASVYYFEAVDERVFAYTKDNVLEVRARLYELEQAHADKLFARCSKSVLINLMKLESISPSLNGRFIAHMKNGEKIVISRQYANALKKVILEGVAHDV